MQTVGPLALTAGATLTQNDPAKFTPANTDVQVQNNSGYLVTANIGGAQYAIPPFTATTVPTNESPLLQITNAATLSNFGGAVTLVWLQPGEKPPTPDGSLFVGNSNQGGLQVVSKSQIGNGGGQILPTPAAGYAYRIHSVTVAAQNSEAVQIIASLTTVGLPFFESGSFPYPASASGNSIRETFLLNGLLIAGQISQSSTCGTSGSVTYTMYYDLVQI